MTNTAIILIDIQNDYFPGGAWEVPGMEAAAANAARLIDHARTAGMTVIHVRHQALAENAPFFRAGTQGAEINDSVAPQSGETVVVKHRPNSYVGTDLEALLREAQCQAVILCGAMSQMCIDATARASVDLGFKTTVISDACAARSMRFGSVEVPADMMQAAFMAPLAMSYATVETTEDCLARLAADG